MTQETKLYDPGEYTVAEVTEYLQTADETERERVFAAERDGKDRAGIMALRGVDQVPEPATHTPPAHTPPPMTADEKAARAALPADVQTGEANPPGDDVVYSPEDAVRVASARARQWATPVDADGTDDTDTTPAASGS